MSRGLLSHPGNDDAHQQRADGELEAGHDRWTRERWTSTSRARGQIAHYISASEISEIREKQVFLAANVSVRQQAGANLYRRCL